MVHIRWSRLQLVLEVPDEWTPIDGFLWQFLPVWREYNARCPAGDEIRDWRIPVFVWWKLDNIEFSGLVGAARRRPDESDYTILDYDPDERRPEYFAISGSRLTHRSGEVIYGLRLRAKRPAPPPKQPDTGQPTAAEPPPVEPPDASQSVAEQRIALVCEMLARGAIAPAASYKEARRALEAVHGSGHPLLQIGDRAQRQCWQAARERHLRRR